MLLVSALTLLAALAGLVGARVTEERLAAGRGDYADLASVTGTWSRAELATFPGVRTDAVGRLGFDPRFRDRLPRRPWRRWLDRDEGHGACLAVALAAGATGVASPDPPPLLAAMLLAAASYEATARLWTLALAVRDT